MKFHGFCFTIILITLFTGCTFAQLDTTDYFPMHVGDKWQYSFAGTDGYIILISGDTIMPNGIRYFIREYRTDPNIPADYPWYLRKRQDGFVVRYIPGSDQEYEWLNLKAHKGEIWLALPPDSTEGFWGVKDTGTYHNTLTNSFLKYKLYDCVRLPDTIWCSETPDTEPPTLTQGLGITGTFFSSCYGAIINGVTYGTVSVDESNTLLPEQFSLSQNYPNPFNPETVIRFALPVSGYAKGVVYDVLGKEVATLVNGEISAGNHEVRFNATDLSSGVYFFRLESGNFSSAIKMVAGK
jgi:hypothetical protein